MGGNVSGWSLRASMPTARAEFAAAALGGKIYVAGGNSGTTALATVDVYDPVADTWSPGTPMPQALYRIQAATFDGRLYVFGGTDQIPSGSYPEIEPNTFVYDPAADSWSQLTDIPLPQGIWKEVEAITYDDQILVIGYQLDSIAPKFAMMFDPVSSQWTTPVAPPPAHGFTFQGEVLDGAIYGIATGTWGMDPLRPFAVLEDPANGVWRTLPGVPRQGTETYPNDDMGFGAAYGHLIAAGGYQDGAMSSKFDVVTGSWSPAPALGVSRALVQLVEVTGRLYAIGGIAASESPRSAYVPVDALEELTP